MQDLILVFFIGGKTISNYTNYTVKDDTKDYIKNFDFGGIVAAGANFKLSSAARLNTDIAYYNGFENISKIKYNVNTMVLQTNILRNESNNYNKNLQFNVSLLIGLRKK